MTPRRAVPFLIVTAIAAALVTAHSVPSHANNGHKTPTVTRTPTRTPTAAIVPTVPGTVPGTVAASPGPTQTAIPTPSALGQVYVHDYGSVQLAINAGCGGKIVVFDPIVYTMPGTTTICSNVILQGSGATLKLVNGAASNAKILRSNGSSSLNIFGFAFDANIAGQSWSEYIHAIGIYGGSDVYIHNNSFSHLVGDGVYVDSGAANVRIVANTFVGTHGNRNGVSIIWASHVTIQGNNFLSMSRPDMPGAIDLEPDTSGQPITDVLIADNIIDGGDGSVVTNNGIRLSDHFGTFGGSIVISGNEVFGSGIWAGIVMKSPKTSLVVYVDNNYIHGLRGTVKPSFGGPDPEAIYVANGMTERATNNRIDDIRGWGLTNDDSCLIQSGNVITNTTLAPVYQWNPKC